MPRLGERESHRAAARRHRVRPHPVHYRSLKSSRRSGGGRLRCAVGSFRRGIAGEVPAAGAPTADPNTMDGALLARS